MFFDYFYRDYEIKTSEKGYVLEIKVPGYEKKDLDIFIEEDVLNVVSKDEKINYKFKLPKDAKVKDAFAECKNGILTILIPKKNLKKIVL
jgi:HSP20 family molecular chaperone IbpA